ncbi:MAG: ATP synthase F1 subunit gamma [Candidatus Omnitrophota bacterium]|nr:ATP synthase F1 subunit gamma [Candidatus Omnitrophota bacterium]MBU1929847.1 ATP synthase F1 subunit gamma [Candidatus Omnitrophota bacterium]MBU2034676.1 ATP synthase F1 subunit gamma [Candidatus Omnitrophota bacterium]MBU2222194.1 ATP synthase F1 subunit gamma [Candidatus Omnitrophota bacterium]
MALSLKQIKNRINGIQDVNKITHAMEMISLAKLKPSQNQLLPQSNYFLKMEELLRSISVNTKGIIDPLFQKKEEVKKIILCLVTSDTGLCASYNDNIIRFAEEFMGRSGKKCSLVAVGRRGLSYFKSRQVKICRDYTDLHGKYSAQTAEEIFNTLVNAFLSGEADEVYIAYTYFGSALRHKLVIEKLLELDLKPEKKEDFIFEPGQEVILKELIPAYVFNKIKLVLLNAFTCEHSVRAIAMGQATENAKGLLEDLTLLRNKVRQAGITREILEVISSAEVLLK